MTQKMRTTTLTGALGEGFPRGAESIIEYNGLVLNDRRRPSAYIVNAISGLSDADIVESREENPDREGEFVQRSKYGGRTISLKGYIRAGSLEELRYMDSNLADAFADINQEREMIFRWRDFKEEFQDATALNDWTIFEGAGTFATPNGSLVATTTANKRMYVGSASGIGRPSRFYYADGMVIQKVTLGPGAISGTFHAAQNMHKVLDGNAHHLFARFTLDTGSIELYKSDPSHVSLGGTISGVQPTLAPNDTYWIVSYVEGNDFTIEIWETDPLAGEGTWVYKRSTTMTGSTATAFGAGVKGRQGIYYQGMQSVGAWVVDSVESIALNPGDASIKCKKAAKLEGPENTGEDGYKMDFMVTVRSSVGRLRSRFPATKNVAVATGSQTFDAGGAGLTFPSSGAGIIFALPSEIYSLSNLGRRKASLNIRFNGPLTNPFINAVDRPERLGVDRVISTGDWVEINTEPGNSYVRDSSGNPIYSSLIDDYKWIELDGKETVRVTLGAEAGSGNAVIQWRHGVA